MEAPLSLSHSREQPKRRKYQIITCLKALNHNKRQLKYDVKLRNAIKSSPKIMFVFPLHSLLTHTLHIHTSHYSFFFVKKLLSFNDIKIFDFSTLSTHIKSNDVFTEQRGKNVKCLRHVRKAFLMNIKLNNKERSCCLIKWRASSIKNELEND